MILFPIKYCSMPEPATRGETLRFGEFVRAQLKCKTRCVQQRFQIKIRDQNHFFVFVHGRECNLMDFFAWNPFRFVAIEKQSVVEKCDPLVFPEKVPPRQQLSPDGEKKHSRQFRQPERRTDTKRFPVTFSTPPHPPAVELGIPFRGTLPERIRQCFLLSIQRHEATCRIVRVPCEDFRMPAPKQNRFSCGCAAGVLFAGGNPPGSADCRPGRPHSEFAGIPPSLPFPSSLLSKIDNTGKRKCK